MTAQETERVDPPGSGTGAVRSASTKSSGKAYERRLRRQELARGRRLTTTGSPIAAALTRVPFVALILLLLAGGVVGVLYLNTISDAAGLRASQSRLAQMDLDTKIEAAQKNIASAKDPARLADEAKSLGLVPPADPAIIQIDASGKATVIGTPTAVPLPAPAAAPTTAAPAAAATVQAVVTVAVTAPPRSTAAPKVVPPKVVPPKVVPAAVVPPKATAPAATAPVSAATRKTQQVAPTTGVGR